MSWEDCIGNPRDRREREELRLLREIHVDLCRILKAVDRIPVTIKFHFTTPEGGIMAAPISKLVGSTVSCSVPVEKNAEGGNIPIVPANITWQSDTPTVSGPITANPDGSASFVGQAPGTCTITCTDLAFTLSDSGVATFTSDVTPVSLTFTFS